MRLPMIRLMRRRMKATRNLVRILGEVFDDWLTRAAGIVCILIVVIVIYNMRSELSETYPLLGALVYAMVPVLFIAGGVIFVMAILKFSRPEDNDEKSLKSSSQDSSDEPS